MKKNFGKNTLGGGNKLSVDLHGYQRSTHNLSKVVRTSMNVGTLVPIYTNIGLNGDTFNIDLNALVKTKPAVAPLFGNYKMQIDVFVSNIRLYVSAMHNNPLDAGNNVSKIKLPKMLIPKNENNTDGIRFNQSSLLAYLGLRGLEPAGTEKNHIYNALPLLAYYDIFKNYYANKQEENAYVVGNTTFQQTYAYGIFQGYIGQNAVYTTIQNGINSKSDRIRITNAYVDKPQIYYVNEKYSKGRISAYGSFSIEIAELKLGNNELASYEVDTNVKRVYANANIQKNGETLRIEISRGKDYPTTAKTGIIEIMGAPNKMDTELKLTPFPLKNIDDMREDILQKPFYQEMQITENSPAPYGINLKLYDNPENGYAAQGRQNGLCVKTFQSDILQNYLNSEWIDGVSGIAEITKIDTSDGLKLDDLYLAKKVYELLNRVAVSGGTWDDYQEAAYGDKIESKSETPEYVGGMSSIISFEEVISTADAKNAQAENQPLGTLAGKGTISNKKGGKIVIRVKEPSIIMAIASITPLIDYSQGNKWYMNELDNIADLHVPALDGIGFQNLKAYQAHYACAKSQVIGKSPAWINYMTDVNECYGDFAIGEPERYMVLQKEFETESGELLNPTTYIDPTQFNYTFADSTIGAQNFWVQVALDIKARRKMSAKIMPNL